MTDTEARIEEATALVQQLRTLAHGRRKDLTADAVGNLCDLLDLALWGPKVYRSGTVEVQPGLHRSTRPRARL